MGWRDKYEFDWKFYVVSAAVIGALLFGLHFVKRTIEISRGKDIQALVDQVAFDSMEHARTQARVRVAGERQAHQLTDAEAKKLEEIYTRAYHEHHTIWRDDRMKGLPESATREKHNVLWNACYAEVNNYIYSIRKDGAGR